MKLLTGIQKVYRLLRYRNERRLFLPALQTKRKQNALLASHYNPRAGKLIVFIVPGVDWHTGKEKISGGTMSIVSLCEETVALKSLHNAETLLCTMNNDHVLLTHTLFENKTTIYRFDQLADYFASANEVLIHIPEFLTKPFIHSLTRKDLVWMRHARMHINILNQNIRFMPERDILHAVERMAQKVTITTAHQKYCTAAYRQHYGVPLHKLSVWISPEQYHLKKAGQKENLIVVSPDAHPQKESVMNMLQKVPGLTVQVIQGLSYSEYKSLIARARWALTFGEGLDGYFIEPVFSGAVSFAVYNEEFFTADFATLETVYQSFDELENKMKTDLLKFNDDSVFTQYQQQQFELCAQYYSRENYRKNIADFYMNRYTYG